MRCGTKGTDNAIETVNALSPATEIIFITNYDKQMQEAVAKLINRLVLIKILSNS